VSYQFLFIQDQKDQKNSIFDILKNVNIERIFVLKNKFNLFVESAPMLDCSQWESVSYSQWNVGLHCPVISGCHETNSTRYLPYIVYLSSCYSAMCWFKNQLNELDIPTNISCGVLCMSRFLIFQNQNEKTTVLAFTILKECVFRLLATPILDLFQPS